MRHPGPRPAIDLLVSLRIAQITDQMLKQLVPEVYDDVPFERHGAAARSLLAHLVKLVKDGAATEVDGVYVKVGSTAP